MPTHDEKALDALSPETPATEAWRAYRTGMRGLGAVLLATGALQLLSTGAMFVFDVRVGMAVSPILVGTAAVHLGVGVLLWLGYHWANYAVTVWGILLVATNLVFFDLLGQRPTHDGWVFCLLPVALIGFSVLNIIRYERALVSSPPDC